MHQRLAALDPDVASKVHANNVRYVIRALEIVQQTKQTLSPQSRVALRCFKGESSGPVKFCTQGSMPV